MSTRLAELERFCRNHIPVAEAMQVEFAAFDGRQLELRAPLAANLNHHGTVFGGSQYATAAVAGWGLIKLTLEQAGLAGDAVITHADVDYKRPLRDAITLTCRLRDAEQFVERCRGHRNATADVDAEIRDGGRVAMRLSASFYVTVQESGPGG